MMWTMLSADEVALFEERESTPCFVDEDEPEKMVWSRTICGVPVAISAFGLEHSLSVLDMMGFRSAVREVLTQVGPTWVNYRCLADWLTGYGMMSELARVLERSAPACEYVLALALANVSDEKKRGYIVQAQDLSRSALAKHAAHDALRDVAMQSMFEIDAGL